MKNYGLYLVVLIATLLVGCRDQFSRDNIFLWNVAPVEINIYIVDSTGVDLLNPDNPNNIILEGLAVQYKAKQHLLDADLSPKLFRASEAVFSGLTLKYSNEMYYMSLGEFSAEESFDGNFIIEWGDGRSQEYLFDYVIEWDEQGVPTNNIQYYDDSINVCGDGVLIIVR